MVRKEGHFCPSSTHKIFGLRFKTEGTFNILIEDVNHRNILSQFHSGLFKSPQKLRAARNSSDNMSAFHFQILLLVGLFPVEQTELHISPDIYRFNI